MHSDGLYPTYKHLSYLEKRHLKKLNSPNMLVFTTCDVVGTWSSDYSTLDRTPGRKSVFFAVEIVVEIDGQILRHQ
jgi:hypothetical protein